MDAPMYEGFVSRLSDRRRMLHAVCAVVSQLVGHGAEFVRCHFA
jgi:hypothetical protein